MAVAVVVVVVVVVVVGGHCNRGRFCNRTRNHKNTSMSNTDNTDSNCHASSSGTTNCDTSHRHSHR